MNIRVKVVCQTLLVGIKCLLSECVFVFINVIYFLGIVMSQISLCEIFALLSHRNVALWTRRPW